MKKQQAKTAPPPPSPLLSKHEIIHQVASRADIALGATQKVIAAFQEIISENLARGVPVRLMGFGTWERRKISGRTIRAIRSGEPTRVPPHERVSFRVGRELARSVEQPEG